MPALFCSGEFEAEFKADKNVVEGFLKGNGDKWNAITFHYKDGEINCVFEMRQRDLVEGSFEFVPSTEGKMQTRFSGLARFLVDRDAVQQVIQNGAKWHVGVSGDYWGTHDLQISVNTLTLSDKKPKQVKAK